MAGILFGSFADFWKFSTDGQGECHARSAHAGMPPNTRTLVSAPFHKFLVPYQGFFFSFPSI